MTVSYMFVGSGSRYSSDTCLLLWAFEAETNSKPIVLLLLYMWCMYGLHLIGLSENWSFTPIYDILIGSRSWFMKGFFKVTGFLDNAMCSVWSLVSFAGKHSFELRNHLVISLCTHESPWDGCTSINMVKWCEMSPKFLPPNLSIALHHAHGPPCSACHGPAPPGLVPGGSTPWRHGGRGDPRRCRRPTSRRRCWKGVKRLVVG